MKLWEWSLHIYARSHSVTSWGENYITRTSLVHLRQWCGLNCRLGSTRPLTSSLLRGSRPIEHILGCQDGIKPAKAHTKDIAWAADSGFKVLDCLGSIAKSISSQECISQTPFRLTHSDRFHLRNPLPLFVSNTPVKPHDCSGMAAHWIPTINTSPGSAVVISKGLLKDNSERGKCRNSSHRPRDRFSRSGHRYNR